MCDETCLPLFKLCNGKVDCYDGFDEENCNSTIRVNQINYLFPYSRAINATSFLIFWYMSVPFETNATKTASRQFEYLPSISVSGTNEWKNNTKWIENTEYRFLNLKPYTKYNATVYVREKGSTRVDPPFVFSEVTTAEGSPSHPLNVTVSQLNGSRVQVSWQPPQEPSGVLKEYTVYYTVQTINVQPVSSVKVSPMERSIVLESNFEGNKTYAFWVKARNGKNESPSSLLVQLTFDDVSNIDRLTNLMTTSVGPDFISLSWSPISGVDGYLVQPVLPQPYPKLNATRVTEPQVKLTNLVPGGHINIKVRSLNTFDFTEFNDLPKPGVCIQKGAVWSRGISIGLAERTTVTRNSTSESVPR